MCIFMYEKVIEKSQKHENHEIYSNHRKDDISTQEYINLKIRSN